MSIMKKLFLLLTALFCGYIAQAQDLSPGVDRWSIKTSLAPDHQDKKVKLQTLLDLEKPIKKASDEFDDKRIPKQVNGLKEGDLITTKGYLLLVALERDTKKHRDGDYHIQMRTSGEKGDSCFIVEIPFPDFIDDPALKEQCKNAREFVRKKLLKDKEPGTGGNVMQHDVYVTVTGQLFFDSAHINSTERNNKGKCKRGKKDMCSFTPWELHPVTSINFAPKPN